MNFQHYPVMSKEVLDIFSHTDKKSFIDCTLGMGGHSYYLLRNFKKANITAIDLDRESMNLAKINLKEFGERIKFHVLNFITLFEHPEIEVDNVSGILVDPGISTYQLKEKKRGFSHNTDGPLDMRKDPTSELTAYQVVNQYSEQQLSQIFEDFGEINNSKRLAKRIIEARLFNPIASTSQLKSIIDGFKPWKPKTGKSHPAAQVFQALRIAINRELDGIEDFLLKAATRLKQGARIVFLSFHSLEDRIAKRTFKRLKDEGVVKILKPFPAFPSEEEVRKNLASRSVKLRAVEIL